MEKSPPDYQALSEKLEKIDQVHLLAFWDELNREQRLHLAEQIDELDADLILELSDKVLKDSGSVEKPDPDLKPADVILLDELACDLKRQKKAVEVGNETLAAGQIGVVVVAGGQGTRLGFDSPKGVYPVGPITNRSLFQYHTEKILALEKRFAVSIPFCIMTSEATDLETREFFARNRFFGKTKDSVYFFRQGMLPSFSPQGKILLEKKWQISRSPDGHGGLLNALNQRGLLQTLQAKEIGYLYYFQVDNVLTRIGDPLFIGLHRLTAADISSKTVRKRDPDEKLGNICKIGDRYRVVEYTELSEQQKMQNDAQGNPLFAQGSIAIHLFNLSFMQSLLGQDRRLPFHLARKKISCIDKHGNPLEPEEPNGYKLEQFIFDAFVYADKVTVVETEREREFSPIKNASGNDSPQKAQQDLSNIFADWLEFCGISVKRDLKGNSLEPIEISPLYADQPDLLCKKIAANPDVNSFLFE
ncbi:UTP--glucose-1-phosphate uridylyltransferase [candidate division KSB1 bacterium]|nr:UTP--glucose-1-phosphate uridylyltransferase [candidate division KSB1 bacterium]